MEQSKESLSVKVQLRVKDVLRYNMFVAYRSWFSKLIVLVGVGIWVWLIYKIVTSPLRFDLFLSQNIIMIVLGVFIVLATPMKVWRITATQMQSPIFSGTSEYVFSKEDIFIRINELEDTVPWTTYSFIRETKHDFRFFVDPVQAQIIPKHCMNTDEQKILRKLISEANPKEVYKIQEV